MCDSVCKSVTLAHTTDSADIISGECRALMRSVPFNFSDLRGVCSDRILLMQMIDLYSEIMRMIGSCFVTVNLSLSVGGWVVRASDLFDSRPCTAGYLDLWVVKLSPYVTCHLRQLSLPSLRGW